MKKSLLVIALLITFAASSFAGVSFLTANSVGVGKFALLGMYATNHIGDNGGVSGDPAWQDSVSAGLRCEYGLMKDLDLLVAYTNDTFVNLRAFTMGAVDVSLMQRSGNTSSIGFKYTVMKGNVDVAALVGFEQSLSTVTDAGHFTAFQLGEVGLGMTTVGIGCIVSKQIGIVVPYGAIGYKSLTKHENQYNQSQSGVGLAFNIGAYIGIAENQAVAIEYNVENRSWTDGGYKPGYKAAFTALSGKVDGDSDQTSGISVGYVYMF